MLSNFLLLLAVVALLVDAHTHSHTHTHSHAHSHAHSHDGDDHEHDHEHDHDHSSCGGAAVAREHAVEPVDVALLDRFFDAWNDHNVDRLMSFMASEAVFHAASGKLFVGTADVTKAFREVFDSFPDARWTKLAHVVDDKAQFAVSTWTFEGTDKASGVKTIADGVDLLTFNADGKVTRKNAFRKPVVIQN